MAHVHIPALLRVATEGREWVEVAGAATVRDVVRTLEEQYPEIRGKLVREGRLSAGFAVAIDGEISSLGLGESVDAGTEVQFLTAIQGG